MSDQPQKPQSRSDVFVDRYGQVKTGGQIKPISNQSGVARPAPPGGSNGKGNSGGKK